MFVFHTLTVITGRDNTCEVELTSGSLTETATFEYLLDLTPTIIDVYPRRGGTGGGTDVTIIGKNLGR